MPAPDRAEIPRRAKDAYREHGRGFVVVDDREEPHCGLLPELEELLEDEPGAETLVASLVLALRIYVPEREAVLVDSRPEGIDVKIVSETETLVIGGITWLKEHWGPGSQPRGRIRVLVRLAFRVCYGYGLPRVDFSTDIGDSNAPRATEGVVAR